MVKLVNFSETDADFIKVVLAHQEVVGDLGGQFYKAIVDGSEKFICHFNDTTYICYYIKDKLVYYDTFFVDNKNELQAVLVGEFMKSVDKNPIFYDLNKGIESFIEIIIRENGQRDVDGFDALLTYSQYNPESDLTLVTMSQFMSSASNKVYQSDVRFPFQVMVVRDKKSIDHYILQKALGNKILNMVTSIKDFGLVNFLSNGSYALQESGNSQRYFRMYGLNKDGYADIHFPFCKSYNLEELKRIVEAYGFSFDIPDAILEEFNSDTNDYDLYREMIEKVSEVEKKEVKPWNLILNYGDK